MRRPRQSGFTLLESMIAMFVVLGTVAMIAYGMRATSKSAEAVHEGQDILVLVENIRRTYEHVGHYGGLTHTSVVTAQLAPQSLLRPYGGVLYVQVVQGYIGIEPIDMTGAVASEPNHAFQLVVPTNRERCQELIGTLGPHVIGLDYLDRLGGHIDGYNLITSPTTTSSEIQQIHRDACAKGDNEPYSIRFMFT